MMTAHGVSQLCDDLNVDPSDVSLVQSIAVGGCLSL